LVRGNLSDLLLMSDCKRAHVMKALSALSKFLGVYERFSSLIKNYGLKWAGKRTEDLIIDRLLKAKDPDEVFQWTRDVKRLIPDLKDFMDLITVAGLRYNETVESYNLIIKLAEEGRLSEYFNAESGALEHYRFRKTFIREGKKVFISFVPEELVQRISDNKPLNYGTIQTWVKRKVGQMRFGDIREVYASVMTKHLRQPEIDFLQGRVSTSIFMRNYFNPAWISDLKSRALQGVEELLATLN
jgi:intergrase/recombinase